MSDQPPDGRGKGARTQERGIRRWARMCLETAYQFAVALNFLQLAALIIGLALVVSVVLSIGSWDWLYGVRGTPVVVVTLIVAFLTAAPITAFVVYVIRKAEDARAELAQSNVALGKARDEAEAGSRAKTQFLANVSHELRTPLNAVIGFSEIMRSESLGPLGHPKYRDYVEDVHGSGVYLLKLIEDILDVSRIEAGTFELREEATAVGEIARSVIGLMGPKAHQEGVALRNELAAAALPPLYADMRAMKQMLLNLVSNGVKFTPRGGAVELSGRIDRDGSMVVAVSDTGPGIGPEDVERAVAPFSRLDDAMTRKQDGVGLGLSLTRSLIEMHGGGLTISRGEERGTVVELRFPAWRVAPERSTPKPSPAG